jgi:hypothetical protein
VHAVGDPVRSRPAHGGPAGPFVQRDRVDVDRQHCQRCPSPARRGLGGGDVEQLAAEPLTSSRRRDEQLPEQRERLRVGRGRLSNARRRIGKHHLTDNHSIARRDPGDELVGRRQERDWVRRPMDGIAITLMDLTEQRNAVLEISGRSVTDRNHVDARHLASLARTLAEPARTSA